VGDPTGAFDGEADGLIDDVGLFDGLLLGTWLGLPLGA
jgi:hypothetical protein